MRLRPGCRSGPRKSPKRAGCAQTLALEALAGLVEDGVRKSLPYLEWPSTIVQKPPAATFGTATYYSGWRREGRAYAKDLGGVRQSRLFFFIFFLVAWPSRVATASAEMHGDSSAGNHGAYYPRLMFPVTASDFFAKSSCWLRGDYRSHLVRLKPLSAA
jgi:hypothetical protein